MLRAGWWVPAGRRAPRGGRGPSGHAGRAGERAAGLATQEFFLEDVAEPRVIQNGRMSTVPVAPEPDRLAALAASSERRDWWLERVRRVWERG